MKSFEEIHLDFDGPGGTLCGTRGPAHADDAHMVTCARCQAAMLPHVSTCLQTTLQMCRVARGLTQAQLARRAGSHEMSVSKMERGASGGPDVHLLSVLSWAMEVTPDAVMAVALVVRDHALVVGQPRLRELYNNSGINALLLTWAQDAVAGQLRGFPHGDAACRVLCARLRAQLG